MATEKTSTSDSRLRRRKTSCGFPIGKPRRLFHESLEDRRLLAARFCDVFSSNALAAEGESANWLAELTGEIVDGGTTYPLTIAPRSVNQGTLIDPGRTTWLVIHGRLGAAGQLIYQDIARAVDGYSADDQVLLLDWETAATGFWDGESRIEPVGRWAASALNDYGFDASNLNLLGYSWGTYVADELAEALMASQAIPVNSILLLDPATDVPFNNYDPNDTATVNFAAHSNFSWAFHASDFEGSDVSPKTAHESFVVVGSDHYEIRSQFVQMLDTNHAGQLENEWFSLGRLLNQGAPSAPWLPNAINASGDLVPNATGGYEAIVDMDADGAAQWLSYEPTAGPADQLRTEPFWMDASPQAIDDLFQVDMADWDGSLQRDALAGVLANDTGTGLTAELAQGPYQGDVVLDPNGAFVYTPWESPTPFGFHDEFTYEISNQNGQTDTAIAEIVGLPNLQNQDVMTDVNASGWTTPLDALLLINVLNQFGPQPVSDLVAQDDVPVYLYDVNGNGEVTAADVLMIVDELNAPPNASGEGEASSDPGGLGPIRKPPFVASASSL